MEEVRFCGDTLHSTFLLHSLLGLFYNYESTTLLSIIIIYLVLFGGRSNHSAVNFCNFFK